MNSHVILRSRQEPKWTLFPRILGKEGWTWLFPSLFIFVSHFCSQLTPSSFSFACCGLCSLRFPSLGSLLTPQHSTKANVLRVWMGLCHPTLQAWIVCRLILLHWLVHPENSFLSSVFKGRTLELPPSAFHLGSCHNNSKSLLLNYWEQTGLILALTLFYTLPQGFK